MLQKYNINKIYCDEEFCKFSIITANQIEFGNSNLNFVIRFKPSSNPVNNNTTNIL